MKNFVVRILLISIVVVLCYMLAIENPFWSKKDELENMTSSNIVLTLLDDETVQLENTLKGSDFLYSWKISNTIDGSALENYGTLPLEDRDKVEFTFQDLDSIEFQAIVIHDGVEYTSNVFYVDSKGELSQSEKDNGSTIEELPQIGREISDVVSVAYLAFIFLSLIVYYLSPKKIQSFVLLAISVIFYTLSGVQFLVFLIGSATVAYFVSKKMSERLLDSKTKIKEESDLSLRKKIKQTTQKNNKSLLITAFIGILGVMVVIKYSTFIIENINELIGAQLPIIKLLMPLGLSFYSFMLIAYLIDVYRGKYEAEKSYWRFFLFASFFTHVGQGPISRYDEVSPQFHVKHKFDYENVCKGAQRILWGFFIKLVLADRIAILVNDVYSNYEEHSWLMLVIATTAFSIQVYADFYSSMEIAIGTSQMFGIKLSENFLRPYFSKSMPEFWRRWHVTLGTWFRDYIFYPIAISKKLMKFSNWSRKLFGSSVSKIIAAIPPIIGVWILTGLWHGASWNFISWGIYHGILIVLSTIFAEHLKKGFEIIGIKTTSWDYKLLQMIKVFILCTIGRIFFRAENMEIAKDIIVAIFSFSNPSNELFNFSNSDLVMIDYIVIAIAIVMLFIVSLIQEVKAPDSKNNTAVRDLIGSANIIVRWAIWFLLIFMVIVFGIYGPNNEPIFIYDDF